METWKSDIILNLPEMWDLFQTGGHVMVAISKPIACNRGKVVLGISSELIAAYPYTVDQLESLYNEAINVWETGTDAMNLITNMGILPRDFRHEIISDALTIAYSKKVS